MTRPTLTADLARASGFDAAERNMRANGRTAWSEDDADVAASTTNKLLLYVPFERGGLAGLLFSPKDRRDLGLDP